MDTVTVDGVDRRLLHALQLDGRAPFRRIAAVLGVSENTVARRYQRLRAADAVRVVGGVDGARLGLSSWTVRIRCTPDAGATLAAALARRADTFWVHLLSAGTEISCFTQAAAGSDASLLARLPRTPRVLGMSAHLVLRGFAVPGGWVGLAALSDVEAAQLRAGPVAAGQAGEPVTTDPTAGPVTVGSTGEPVTVDAADDGLLAALAVDGRTGFRELAARTGWSESAVRRRTEHLRRSGVLRYELDVAPAILGHRVEARLWLSVRPTALVAVATALAGHPEVTFAAITTGPTNLMAAVTCRDEQHLYRYLTERVGALEGVRGLESAPVLRTVKRIGALLPR